MIARRHLARTLGRLAGPARLVSAALLALSCNLGCGREFFRQWANQDATEAVFEKSRDPRWRLDMFSIEPPALSRFVDPYDPDRPPAPPDDRAAEALSPAPQWPHHRLIVPVEGTGYLDMLETWQRQRDLEEPPQPPREPITVTPDDLMELPPPSPTPSPFLPDELLGPDDPGMSPILIPNDGRIPNDDRIPNDRRIPNDGRTPPENEASRGTRMPYEVLTPEARARVRDLGVRLVAFQETEIPMPVRPPGDEDDLPRVIIDVDPRPGVDADLTEPLIPRFDITPEEREAARQAIATLMELLVPRVPDLTAAEAAGLPVEMRLYQINLQQALSLALINSRAYQFRLEQIYLDSLPVTFQRFNFEPQFFAGLAPTTAPAAGGFTPNFFNSFLYRTEQTRFGQASNLSLGTAAGFGKIFISGARVVGHFANQVVFDFVGPTPRQPLVESVLPLSIVQPFLRGGGRAVALEPLTQAERTLLYQIRSFARFRQEFFTSIMVGGAVTAPGLPDPVIGFLPLLRHIQIIENNRNNVLTFEGLFELYSELAEGEASGLTQLQVDQIDSDLQSSRNALLAAQVLYRNQLDQFKMQLGLPPDVPLAVDAEILAPFRETFRQVDLWATDPDRELEVLPRIMAQLPELEDVIVDGRSVLDMVTFREGDEQAQLETRQQQQLEDLLRAAERVALENRLDLMNARAELYDAWRQLRFTANALLGVFNVTLTNQVFTQINPPNPFAFLDQAKQFNLVLNAELPLIRVFERNAFRAALLNYQRQRRALMNLEDAIKLQVRILIRELQVQYQQYEIEKRNFVLNLRQRDQAQEQILAPPAAVAGAQAAANAATQTLNLIRAQTGVLGSKNRLIDLWLGYQSQRLQIYRDLGIMPYDEWEAFYELFPPDSATTPPVGDGPGVGPAAAAPAAEPAPEPVFGP